MRTLARRTGILLLNLWIVFHVFSVFIAPAGMPPASPLLVDAARVAEPYNQLLFLNHGYHYFAPDPGASTLVEYEIPREGDIPIRGRFPNPSLFPRLLYHRYFMLAENVRAFPMETQESVLHGYAMHFAEQHNSDRIQLSFIQHEPSSIARLLAGGLLNDPETYSVLPIGSYRFENLSSDAEPSSASDF